MAGIEPEHPLDRAINEAIDYAHSRGAKVDIMRVRLDPPPKVDTSEDIKGKPLTPRETEAVAVLETIDKPTGMTALASKAGRLGDGKGEGYFGDTIRRLINRDLVQQIQAKDSPTGKSLYWLKSRPLPAHP